MGVAPSEGGGWLARWGEQINGEIEPRQNLSYYGILRPNLDILISLEEGRDLI